MSQAGKLTPGSFPGGFVQQLDADVGFAVPTAGVITIAGGTNINTSAALSTLTVNLDNIVSLTHADDGSTQGYFQFNGINFMHNYGNSNTFVGENAGNNTLTPASSLGNTCVGRLAGSSLTTGSLNTFIGDQSGNACTSGNNNCAIGQGSLGTMTRSGATALGFNTMAAYNPAGPGETHMVAVGFDCLQSITSGISTTAIGSECGQNLTSVTECVLIGAQCCDGVASIGAGNICIGKSVAAGGLTNLGEGNIIIGWSIGSGYELGEAHNIILGGGDQPGDNGVIRIGATLTHTSCYIAGIEGVDVGSVAEVVTIDSNQLGSAVITAGTGITVTPGSNLITISSDGTSTSTYTAVNTTPYVVLSTDQFLGVDSSGGAITVQLPNAPSTGRVYVIKDSTGSANTNNISVTTVGGAVTIDGVTTYTLNIAYQSINVIFNGTSYEVW